MKPRPSVSEMLATIVQLTKLVEDSTLANAPRANEAVTHSLVIATTGGVSKASPNCVYLLVFPPAFIVNLTSLVPSEYHGFRMTTLLVVRSGGKYGRTDSTRDRDDWLIGAGQEFV